MPDEKSGAVGLFSVPGYRGNDCLGTAQALQERLPSLHTIFSLDEFDAFVAAGTPEALARAKGSYTGMALRHLLET